MRVLLIAAVFALICSGGRGQTISPLFARGYTVIPEPQRVVLSSTDFQFGRGWHLQVDSGVPAGDVALQALRDDLLSRFNLSLGGADVVKGILSLRIAPGAVEVGNGPGRDSAEAEDQAYRIDLRKNSVALTANTSTGLFYAVETLVQLLRQDRGELWLPEGRIEDWPDLGLRHIFWDDNHHIERLDELKRDMRQAAFYKINGFVLKLNGHFQYKSAPAVVEPYALTPAELQELTNYGLRYHIQLIPYLDGPAHLHFVLKHTEYSALREFPTSDYEMCATNPATYKFLQGMYQDLLDANKGVSYFYLSTDEAYYLGAAKNAQCDEVTLAAQRGSVGQVFVHYVEKTGGYLHDRGRTVIFWGEYPLKPADVASLPPYLVNGEVNDPNFDEAFHQQGIPQMIYTSTEGEEMMFPNYFLMPRSERLHSAGSDVPTVDSIVKKISFDPSRHNTTVIGEVNAGWADEGVNPETFWLGYVAGGSAGWHPGAPNSQELTSTFYSLFYGPKVESMNQVYHLMSEQAQMWSDSWDWGPSKSRKGIWGGSHGVYAIPRAAKDQTLPLPPVPKGDLSYVSTWSSKNARRAELALQAKKSSELLRKLINENMQRAQFNRYNLEVYLSIADLYLQNSSLIAGIFDMDRDLAAAAQVRTTDPREAIDDVDKALNVARAIWLARNEVLQNTTATWEKAWLPRVGDANGRQFVHELDDVKDHLPDRTVDMSYLVYREKILPFGDWVRSIVTARNAFALVHHLPTRKYTLLWDDFTVLAPQCSSASEILSSAKMRVAHIAQAGTCVGR